MGGDIDTEHGGRTPNRLAQEESPYLLQHAYNPVQWLPWGPEAFDLARTRDVPIFLSIGYSTCHWCHVMERESFESEAIAEILNKNFVPVKVDREERPDVDKLYMTYIQATQGGGGWPMSVFLTPELSPFFGGTYFPPQDAHGRPGFPTVLNRIAEVWAQKKEEIKASSADSMAQLGEVLSSSGGGAEGSQAAAIDTCATQLASRFDSRHGGFGGAPKFPRPAELLLMMTQYARLINAGDEEGAKRILHMATFTLAKMAAGGMHDQLGGGFHRYSVDELWHVPHFEIMLYDQPQLVQAYLAAFQITRNREHALVARGVLDYLLRDLKHPGGAFYAAEDADSLDEKDGKKKEGEFYVWTAEEVESVLGAELSPLFSAHYGIKSNGNCTRSARSDPHDEFTGKNVLYQTRSLAETAKAADTSLGQAEEILSSAREELFNVRAQRPRPHRDEKIVVAWNGMAIGALAVAGRALASEDPPLERLFPVEGLAPKAYLQAAATAVGFIREHLYDEGTGKLQRAFTKGPSAVAAFSDDYAHLISGLLELYFATGDVGHLQWALKLQDKMDELFWDETHGGYFQAAAGDEHMRFRMKEDYDGAEPAASSIAVANLWRFAALGGTEAAAKWTKQAEKCASAFGGQLKEAPVAMPQMCTSLHLLDVGHGRQVVIAGRRGNDDTEALLNAAASVYAPDKILILLDLGDEELMKFWREHNPEAVALAEATGMTAEDPATAFICQNFTCRKPTTDPAAVAKTLSESRGGAVKPRAVNLPSKEA